MAMVGFFGRYTFNGTTMILVWRISFVRARISSSSSWCCSILATWHNVLVGASNSQEHAHLQTYHRSRFEGKNILCSNRRQQAVAKYVQRLRQAIGDDSLSVTSNFVGDVVGSDAQQAPFRS